MELYLECFKNLYGGQTWRDEQMKGAPAGSCKRIIKEEMKEGLFYHMSTMHTIVTLKKHILTFEELSCAESVF